MRCSKCVLENREAASPRSQWKALRTTNTFERINEEFRRRTKDAGFLAR